MITKRKIQLNATISPYTKRRLDLLVNSGLFSSGSDAVDKAICVLYLENKSTLTNVPGSAGIPGR